jgi:hypothetical protein
MQDHLRTFDCVGNLLLHCLTGTKIDIKIRDSKIEIEIREWESTYLGAVKLLCVLPQRQAAAVRTNWCVAYQSDSRQFQSVMPQQSSSSPARAFVLDMMVSSSP